VVGKIANHAAMSLTFASFAVPGQIRLVAVAWPVKFVCRCRRGDLSQSVASSREGRSR
jgi:hypothetical protein